MVCVRVAFHENNGNHENDENDEDNSDSYKQGVERWIRGNHGNHENDENHGNPGRKPRVPQTTGLEIPKKGAGKLMRRENCQDMSKNILPALLQKLVGDFLKYFAGKFGGKFGGNFAGFFLTHRRKAQIFRGHFGAFLVRKLVAQKKSFRAKFTLQMCRLKKYAWHFLTMFDVLAQIFINVSFLLVVELVSLHLNLVNLASFSQFEAA